MRPIVPVALAVSLALSLGGCADVQLNPNAKAIAASAQASAQADQFPADVMGYACLQKLGQEPAQTVKAWGAVRTSGESVLHPALVRSMTRHMDQTTDLLDVDICPDAITGAYRKLNYEVQALDQAFTAGTASEKDYEAVDSAISQWGQVTAPQAVDLPR